MDEDKLHSAILAALNTYGAIRAEVEDGARTLAEMACSRGATSGESLLALQRRLEVLKAEQDLLLDKVLEDMNNEILNDQLKALSEEKQAVLTQIEVQKQDANQQSMQASRAVELEEFLTQQPMNFAEYDDTLTRRLVERITVVDAETIRVKIRDAAVEIEQTLC